MKAKLKHSNYSMQIFQHDNNCLILTVTPNLQSYCLIIAALTWLSWLERQSLQPLWLQAMSDWADTRTNQYPDRLLAVRPCCNLDITVGYCLPWCLPRLTCCIVDGKLGKADQSLVTRSLVLTTTRVLKGSVVISIQSQRYYSFLLLTLQIEILQLGGPSLAHQCSQQSPVQAL